MKKLINLVVAVTFLTFIWGGYGRAESEESKMAVYREDIVTVELESGSVYRSFASSSIGSGDNMANRFGVRVLRNGQPEEIGGSCFGLFVRSDGTTVTINNGTVSGNLAYVDLPEACYAVEGQFTLAIKCQGGNATGTMRIVDGVVSRTSTEEIIDPGTIIPSIEDLIEAIDEAVESIPLDYSALSAGALKVGTTYITPSNYAANLPDADDAETNTVYQLLGNGVNVDNLPVVNFPNGGFLFTFKSDALKVQILLREYDMYKRTGYSTTWNTTWYKATFGAENPVGMIAEAYVTNSNYSNVMADANSARADTVYMLFGNNIQSQNLPFSDFSDVGLLCSYNAGLLKCQIIIYDGTIWKRTGYDSSWNAWEKMLEDREVVRVGATETFTKLTDALEYAYDRGNCDVYVNSGTYDIFTELGGSTYFNSFVFADTEKGGGPVVGNNCRYFFSPGAEVTFYNTTSNADVMKSFSPLNAGNGDFEIEGLFIRCSKCRYAFHDEMTHTGLDNRKTVNHVFRNVSMYKDNTENTAFTTARKHDVIGGGLISHGGETVTIENSYFDNAVAGQTLVSYHNGLGGSGLPSKSKITITGCYFDNGGTARVSSYGDNDEDTVMFVTNCSLGSEAINELETPTSVENTVLYAWNNEIRN